MLTLLSIVVLAMLITGKNPSKLVEKAKSLDWASKCNFLFRKLQPYALSAGRTASRPLLQFFYVLCDDKTSTLEKLLISGALIYIITPMDLLPASVHGILGILDDGVAMAYVYKRIKKKITPEINAKVDVTLNQWFGSEYEPV